MRIRQSSLLAVSAALLFFCVQPLSAKNNKGYLIVHVSPPETYVYADGEPVVESERHFIILDAGDHEIELYN